MRSGVLAAVAVIGGGCAILSAQAPHISSFDRGVSLSMLKVIKEDLTKNYYDPTFRGVDVEKTFAEAAEHIKTANSVAEASAFLADTLLKLDDSHTKFYPPERLTRVEYGWKISMVGDAPFVTWIDKNSDAAAKGLARGDRVLVLNRFEPTRSNLWQLNYVYRHIRPQQLQRLIIRKPDGQEKTLDVASKVQERPSGNIEDLVREIEGEYRTPDYMQKAIGDILVVHLAAFGDPRNVERFTKDARRYKVMIVDLRGNGGGRIDAIERLLVVVFRS